MKRLFAALILTSFCVSAFANPSVQVCRAKTSEGKNLSVTITRQDSDVRLDITVDDKPYASFTNTQISEGANPKYMDSRLLTAKSRLAQAQLVTPGDQDPSAETLEMALTATIKDKSGRTILKIKNKDLKCSL